MKPIRVLQVVTIMNRGGLETMLMNYYRAMDRDVIQLDFMVHRLERGHYDDEIEELGGQIFRMPLIRPGNYKLYFKKLDFFFEEHKEYRIVHSHMNENSSFVLRAAKKANVPIRIAHSHLSDLGIDYKWPFRMYARSLLNDSSNQYFACSKRAGEWLFGKNNTFTVVNNAIDAKEFGFNPIIRSKLREELEIENKTVIGHIGRFNEQKNHEFLIDIFHEINKKNPETILLLIGDGDLKGKIEHKVKKLNLNSSVYFLGVREDIADILQAMDIFLFPSLFEGLGVVLIEAQAAGLGCIVSDMIPEEAFITENIKSLSLKTTAKEWANEILRLKYERSNTYMQLRDSNYDTDIMADWLKDFYIRKSVKLGG